MEKQEAETTVVEVGGLSASRSDAASTLAGSENRHERRRRKALTRKLLKDVASGKVPTPFDAP